MKRLSGETPEQSLLIRPASAAIVRAYAARCSHQRVRRYCPSSRERN